MKKKKKKKSETLALFWGLALLKTVILSGGKLNYETNRRGLFYNNTPALQIQPIILLAAGTTSQTLKQSLLPNMGI